MKTLKFIEKSSYEKYPFFHPDDAEQEETINEKTLLLYTMNDNTVLGFEHIEGSEIYSFDNYNVYEVIKREV